MPFFHVVFVGMLLPTSKFSSKIDTLGAKTKIGARNINSLYRRCYGDKCCYHYYIGVLHSTFSLASFCKSLLWYPTIGDSVSTIQLPIRETYVEPEGPLS